MQIYFSIFYKPRITPLRYRTHFCELNRSELTVWFEQWNQIAPFFPPNQFKESNQIGMISWMGKNKINWIGFYLIRIGLLSYIPTNLVRHISKSVFTMNFQPCGLSSRWLGEYWITAGLMCYEIILKFKDLAIKGKQH